MSVFLNPAKHLMLDYLGTQITHVSLHDGEPDGSGSNELSGGSPAYARKAPTFASASGGEMALNAAIEFDVPAAATVAWVGFWDDSTFVAKGELSASETFAAQGTYTLTTNTKLAITDPV